MQLQNGSESRASDPTRVGDPARSGEPARSVATIQDEVARQKQALLDLAHAQAAGVSVVHCPSAGEEIRLVRALTDAARADGFVTAQLSLGERPVDAIDQLVAAILDALVAPGESRPGGLLGLLARFCEKRRPLSRWDEKSEEYGLGGDLVALCRAYIGAADDAHREVDALTRWALGKPQLSRFRVDGVRGVLDVHSGQRVFGELSRIIQALGYPGWVLVLSQGDSIASRTPRQREKTYTLLRELVDNFDSGRGSVCTRITLTGTSALFSGDTSLRELAPLYARLVAPSFAEPPPPHRTWTSLIKDPYDYAHRKVRAKSEARPASLRALIRLSQGLPPVEGVTQMSVGHERIDKSIDKLFAHAQMAGSVFQILSGEYGSGKTHLLLHLKERALSQGHPVFWLNLERMNLDLGNPARHLARVLEQSVLPLRGQPSVLSRLAYYTRSSKKLKELLSVLEGIAASDAEEARAAERALSLAGAHEDAGAALEDFLSARDLVTKPGGESYRKDAYRRLLLWVRLLGEMEGTQGPVLLIDEAENLYTSGLPELARRSALRTLSFYCGGVLPSACVLLAMTPPALTQMRKEANALLRQAGDVDSTLELEDVELFRLRLRNLVPDEIPEFSRKMRYELADKARSAHRAVRGPVDIEDWEGLVRREVSGAPLPRALLRSLLDHLESAWWAGS